MHSTSAAALASCGSAHQANGSGQIRPFALEQYFVKYEFCTKYLLCVSDSESMTMGELLAMATPEEREMFDNLSLGYTEAAGLPVLRQAIAETFYGGATTGGPITADQVTCFAGAEEAIYCVVKTLLTKRSDHAIAVTPCYQSHISIAESVCGDVTAIALKKPTADGKAHWDLDVSAVRAAIRPGSTRLILLNSPHNPTGTMLSPAAMSELVEVAMEHDVWILCDEVYRGIDVRHSGDGGESMMPSMCMQYSKGISIGGLSKPFGMAGLRTGWVTMAADAPAGMLASIADLKHYLSICNAAPAEVLSLIAVHNARTIFGRNAAIAAANVALLDALIAKYPLLLRWCGRQHVAGVVSFVELLPAPAAAEGGQEAKAQTLAPGSTLCNHRGLSVDQLADKLVRQYNVLILPGSTFYAGSEDAELGGKAFASYFRMGFGRSNFAEGLQRFEAALNEIFGGDNACN